MEHVLTSREQAALGIAVRRFPRLIKLARRWSCHDLVFIGAVMSDYALVVSEYRRVLQKEVTQ
jgi:hypothetical protein